MPSSPRSRTIRLVVAAALVLTGVVWIGQGLGILRSRSFMVDDIRWSWIGLATAIVGLVLAFRAWRAGG